MKPISETDFVSKTQAREYPRSILALSTADLSVAVDEGAESTNAGIDTRLVGTSTSVTPRNSTDDSVGAVDDGTTAVTLARVPATGSNTSTEHLLGDGGSTVLLSAGSTRDDRDSNLQKVDGSSGSALRGSAPGWELVYGVLDIREQLTSQQLWQKIQRQGRIRKQPDEHSRCFHRREWKWKASG
jgi:hypothetical protein